MKLAEALILRADCQKRAAQLRERIATNAKAQEGDAPSENPRELLQQFEQVLANILDLIRRINRTNSQTEFETGKTLTDALAERDVLSLRRKAYQELCEAATIEQHRYMRTEIKFQSVVDVAQIQKQADDLARDYRELDTRIQALNWTTELVE
jgi:hypothetical protein